MQLTTTARSESEHAMSMEPMYFAPQGCSLCLQKIRPWIPWPPAATGLETERDQIKPHDPIALMSNISLAVLLLRFGAATQMDDEPPHVLR